MNYTTLRKRSDWDRIYSFNFSGFAEIAGGETISTATVPAVSGLTIAAPSISGSSVRVRVSGGTAGTKYAVVCTVTTSGGRTLSIVGYFDVVN